MEPFHPLPRSPPRPLGLTLLFVLAPANSLFTHIQITRGKRVSEGPPNEEEAWEESDRQGLMSHGSLFSPLPWLYLPPAKKYSNTPSKVQPQGVFLFSRVKKVSTLIPRKSIASISFSLPTVSLDIKVPSLLSRRTFNP